MGIGDWGLGIGDWGLGPIPNPQSPIPNPQSPSIQIFKCFKNYFNLKIIILIIQYFIHLKLIFINFHSESNCFNVFSSIS